MEQDKINCFQCKFFYITWDKILPYGCKAMGFKTHILPSVYVARASGTGCLSYEAKPRPATDEK